MLPEDSRYTDGRRLTARRRLKRGIYFRASYLMNGNQQTNRPTEDSLHRFTGCVDLVNIEQAGFTRVENAYFNLRV
jgi:hypothetical protein